MRKEPGFIYRVFLVVGDAFAIVASFTFAYYFRLHFDHRPYVFEGNTMSFLFSNLFLLPIWLVVLSSLGLYSRKILQRHGVMAWRLLLASVVGTMSIITYDFFATAIFERDGLFPVKVIALYATAICFLALSAERILIALIFRILHRNKYGLIRTVVAGDGENVRQLLLGTAPESGYKICGVVADSKYIPQEWNRRRYPTLEDAVNRLRPDAVVYAQEDGLEEANKLAIDHHALFYYSPPESSVIALSRDTEFVAGVPVLRIRATPLTGAARVYKRTLDIITSTLLIIVAAPIMAIIFVIQKILDPKASALYKDIRLTRFNKEFPLLKFRSIKPEFSGMTPEEAFTKMGKPELIEKYRSHGDYIKNDPRYTKFGKFLRSSSLDELPQLFNVWIGHISLIGPRALQPGELKDYGDRGLLLSIKSGVSGLAQVSGRRDISFNERRALDIYYIQNWTPMMDVTIFFRTIASVFKRSGAK